MHFIYPLCKPVSVINKVAQSNTSMPGQGHSAPQDSAQLASCCHRDHAEAQTDAPASELPGTDAQTDAMALKVTNGSDSPPFAEVSSSCYMAL